MFLAPHIIERLSFPVSTFVMFSLSALGCFSIFVISPTINLLKKSLSGLNEMISSTSSPTSVRINSKSSGFSLISMNFFNQLSDIFIINKVNQ